MNRGRTLRKAGQSKRAPRRKRNGRPSEQPLLCSRDRPFNHLVVHCRKSEYDVYIGRFNASVRGGSNPEWGNPFRIGDDGMTREDVILRYRDWLLAQPALVEKARTELRDKVLACWCAPQACHGHVLAEVANGDGGESDVTASNALVDCGELSDAVGGRSANPDPCCDEEK